MRLRRVFALYVLVVLPTIIVANSASAQASCTPASTTEVTVCLAHDRDRIDQLFADGNVHSGVCR